jgi:cytochrome c biogenesis protein
MKGSVLKKSFSNTVWSFLISLKLTIIILILLAITSIFGTVIPQNELPYVYLRAYKASTYKIIQFLSLDNMYHSWWFIALLTLFTLNLICCTINRFPGFLRFIKQKDKDLDDQFLKTLPLKKNLRLKTFNEQSKGLLSAVVQKSFHKPTTRQSSPDSLSLFAEKGKYTRLSFYITHLGIILIIVGGMLGNLGWQGYMSVVEGKTNNTLQLKGSTELKKLDFDIRCDEFEVTFYGGSQRPKEFTSNLTIIDQGKEVKQKVIQVNDPLQYKGVWIYQSSYGTAPDQGVVLVGVTPTAGPQQQAKQYNIDVEGRVNLNEEGYELEVKKFVPDFTLGKNNEVVSRSQELRNPAAQLALYKDGTLLEEKWIFAKFPDFHGEQKGPYRFKFLNYRGKEYTGLQLTRDPGVWIVWLGCFLLCLGCYLICFTSHRRLWVKVEPKKDEYLVTLAGSANKNMSSFSRDFEKFFQKVKTMSKSTT